MSTFERVNKAPEKLEKNEMVIMKPDFQKEIDATRGKRGTSNRTTASGLRDLFMAFNDNYETNINPFALKLSKYEGHVIENDDQIRDVLNKIIADNNLPVYEKIIEYSLKTRNPAITSIYYVSDDLSGVNGFIRFGFNPTVKETKKKEKEKVE
jgi:hypothetical protein